MDVRLRVQNPDGSSGPVYEHVQVEPLEGGRYHVLNSPALVEGIAAGDEIELTEDGGFKMFRHGGNVCIQYFRGQGSGSTQERQLYEDVKGLGGRMDTIGPKILVFSVPLRAVGFQRIEAVFDRCAEASEGASWMFGNIYDPYDGRALNWWEM